MLAQKLLKPVRPKVSFHLKLSTWMDLSLKALRNDYGISSGFRHSTLNTQMTTEAKPRPRKTAALRLKVGKPSEVVTPSACVS